MAKAFIDDTNLTNIANAIRTKLGVVDTYLPSEMAGAILSIPKRKVVDFNVSPITLNSAKVNSLQYVKAYGKCEQNGTPTPTSPVDIVCNNGILKVYKNLFDATDPSMIINCYIGSSSVGESANVVSSSGDRSFIIPAEPNTQYTIRKKHGAAPFNRFRVSYSDAMPVAGNTVIKLYEDTSVTETIKTVTVTTGSNANYLIVYGLNEYSAENLQIFIDNFFVSKGSRINVGEIYTQGNIETIQLGTDIANCERLLSLNGYTDTQEILSGIVNRKIGIKVLDGSEDWSVQTSSYPYVYHIFYDGIIIDPNYVLNEKITHFECVPITITTNNQGIIVATRLNRYTAVFLRYDNLFDPTTTSGINTLKTFLQTQYNNGTPVIIVYPLATPTTETVTAQTMQTVAGDNTLEITQAALSGLEVECEYFLQ